MKSFTRALYGLATLTAVTTLTAPKATTQGVSAYITSYSAVPAPRQLAWLKEMTVDICEAKAGCLSDRQLSQAPELIKAWSDLNKIDTYNSARGRGSSARNGAGTTANPECALAVESLVKRVIDEQMAVQDGSAVSELLTANEYNCLVQGWARSGAGKAAAERCEQILTAMQERSSETTLSKLSPDLTTFKAVLMSWREAAARSKVSYAPVRAQRILEWMIRLAATGENAAALPDADCFDMVLQTWSRSGHVDAPASCEHILGVMERLYESTGFESLKPRTTSFNAVLAAWTKSGRPDAAERVSDILNFLEVLGARGDAAPDAVSYTIVMSALAKHPNQAFSARRADVILKHAVSAYQVAVEQEDPAASNLVPDTILFNTAMGIWARAFVPGAYRKARVILERQMALWQSGSHTCQPDVYGFTSVIAACAGARGSKKERLTAFHVASDTYQQLDQLGDTQANHVTYGTMLKACAKLLPAGSPIRRKWVRRVFQQAVKSGCVGDMVLSRLREASPPDIFHELMQGYSKKNIPASWTANVASDNRRKKLPNNRMQRRKRAEV